MPSEPPKAIIVDDDEDVGRVLRVILTLNGFEAFKTGSAEECISKLEELKGGVSVVTITGKIATDRNARLSTG